MIQPGTHVVRSDHGPRPAGPPDRCFYCDARLGELHADECALRTRTVVVRATVEYVIEVPEFWDEHTVEFSRNDSSWCASNIFHELEALEAGQCLCPFVSFAFVREASGDETADYHARLQHQGEAE